MGGVSDAAGDESLDEPDNAVLLEPLLAVCEVPQHMLDFDGSALEGLYDAVCFAIYLQVKSKCPESVHYRNGGAAVKEGFDVVIQAGVLPVSATQEKEF